MELTARYGSSEWIMGVFLFCGLVCIAIANYLQSNIYSSLFIANMKFQGISSFVRSALPLDKIGAFLLYINYWIAGSVIMYLLLGESSLTINANERFLILFTPVLFLFWHVITLVGTGLLTGEFNSLKELIVVKLVSTQLLGILFFVVALIWALNGRFAPIILEVLIWLMIIESVFRWIKSILLISRQGVVWYYIILYFCTLEILPIYVIYYVFRMNF